MPKWLKAVFQIRKILARLDLAEGVCEALEEYERVSVSTGMGERRTSIAEMLRLEEDCFAMLHKWQKEQKS